MAPKGILLDYGGTLVEEVGFDALAGNEALLKLAAYSPPNLTIEQVLERAQTISEQVAERRDEFGIETPWLALTRLIHDFLGVRFELAPHELEFAFWNASVTTRAMPGAREAINEFHRCGIRTAVVSNCASDLSQVPRPYTRTSPPLRLRARCHQKIRVRDPFPMFRVCSTLRQDLTAFHSTLFPVFSVFPGAK